MRGVPEVVLIFLLCNLALAGDAGTVGFGPKGFAISDASGNNFVNFGLNLQPRMSATFNGDPEATDAELLSDTGFRIRRALFLMNGTLAGRVDYRFRFDAAKTVEVLDTGGKATAAAKAILDDAQVIFRIATPFEIAMGQWKVPFTASQVTSDFNMLFPERAMPVEGFKYGDVKVSGFGWSREAGVAVLGSMAEKKLDYQLGIFNGNGTNVWPPPDSGPLVVLRLHAAPLGELKYDEADMEHGKFRVALGTGAAVNFTPAYKDNGSKIGDTRDLRINTELRVAVSGFTMQSELIYGQIFAAEGDNPAPSLGTYAQIGYVIPVGVAPAFRWSRLDPSLEDDGDGLTQLEGAVSWYLPGAKKTHLGHKVKLIGAWATTLMDEADHPVNHTAMLSGVISF
jgi:Phosphate-selective porin O and P